MAEFFTLLANKDIYSVIIKKIGHLEIALFRTYCFIYYFFLVIKGVRQKRTAWIYIKINRKILS